MGVPRDWRLSASWGILKPLGPSQHYRIERLKGPQYEERRRLSDNECKFFSAWLELSLQIRIP